MLTMPPKHKKVQHWFKCENCSAFIPFKDSKTHGATECPCDPNSWTNPFVLSGHIYTHLEINEPDDAISLKSSTLESVIFIHPAALQLTSIVIGDPVLVEDCSGKLPTMIRRVLTRNPNTSAITSISLSQKCLDPSWYNKMNIKIIIRPLINPPDYAKAVHAKCIDGDIIKNSEFKSFIKFSQDNKIYSCGNSIKVSFFGKTIILNIIKITSTYETSEGNYFKISDETDWIFSSDNDKDSKFDESLILAGVDNILNDINSLIDVAFNECNETQKMKQMRCILLFGPSGVGKTLICKYIASKRSVNLVNINGAEIYSKYFGETEITLKKVFDDAMKNSPSIILIDEIDTLCAKKTSSSTDQEKRILSTMAMLLEDLHEFGKKTFVLATTNKTEMIDQSLRRYGRIDFEIEIPVPDIKTRREILSKMFSTFPHSLTDENILAVADSCHGYVGADIAYLCTQASMHAITERKVKSDLYLDLSDVEYALKQVKPSAMREVFINVPDVKWSDIGGQDDLKLKLRQAIEWPLTYASSFARLGIKAPSGVLMYGPPGCSKTMIAKALANESGLNFISIKGPELFSKWVGESERAVREVFRKARQVAPSIIFFDEIDALGSERSRDGDGANVNDRVLAQILTEMDGISPLGNVTIVAATNRPDKIDSALLRPGRLDRIVYVPLPDKETRLSIFKIKLSKMPVSKDVSMENLVERTEKYSGAEINAVCQEAALKALEENIECTEVLVKHFEMALEMVQPRTPKSLLKVYEDFKR